MRLLLLIALTLNIAAVPRTQEYKSSDFADFTRSATEHQMVIVRRPFVVRLVKGRVEFQGHSGQTLRGVLFEIEGPDSSKRIRRASTNGEGDFKIKHVPAGAYRFKATLDGYSSVLGYLTVSREANRDNRVDIAMGIGN